MLPLGSINALGLPEPDVVSLNVVTFNRLLIHIPHTCPHSPYINITLTPTIHYGEEAGDM